MGSAALRQQDQAVSVPDALTPAFATDAAKQRQWTAFVEGIEENPGDLPETIAALASFLMPHAEAARKLG
jgi:hypothetical protein